MLVSKPSKAGRPKEVKGVGKPTTLYLDDTRLSDFKILCEEKYHISTSEGLRQLIEQELEKNEVGEINPTNIQYGLVNKSVDNSNTISISLDKFMDVKDAKKIVEAIPQAQLPEAYNNSKKLNQQIQYRQTGKISV